MPFWPILLAAIAFAAAATAVTMYLQMRPASLDVLFDAPKFQMTSQNGELMSNSNLNEKIWVANFVFVNCGGPCPRMSAAMAKVSQSIDSSRVRFVSFDVDPKRDTPAVLKEYGDRYKADHSRWYFLTEPGTSYMDVAADFKVAVKPADGSTPIIHSEKMFLIDGRGRVRGTYSFEDEHQQKKLIDDIGRLLGE